MPVLKKYSAIRKKWLAGAGICMHIPNSASLKPAPARSFRNGSGLSAWMPCTTSMGRRGRGHSRA